MNFCKDCKRSKKEVVQVGPNPNQLGTVLCCTHGECLNPVDGNLFPCELVRREAVFCRIDGRYFEAKEKEPTPTQPEKATSVIQLS